jgi:hypothetical protein
MLVNWYARKNSNKVTFPIGLNVSKVVKIVPLPVKFAVQGQYIPVHLEVFGQKMGSPILDYAGYSEVD